MLTLIGIVVLVTLATLAVVTARPDRAPAADPPPPPSCIGDCVPRSELVAAQKLAAKRLRGWNKANRRIIGLKYALLDRPAVSEAINLSCTVYGNCSTLWRKARCESHLNPYARNGSEASGLFQFLPSTWRSTPYGRFSIFSAYANALAAGWMHVHGRGGEWVCR